MIHRGQQQQRLERDRLRALKPVRAAAGSGDARRREEPFRRSLDALLATLRRARRSGNSEAAALATRTLSVYRGCLRELRLKPSPSVSAHLLAFAQQHVMAQHLGVLAFEAGLGTSDRALALAGEAQRAQGRAERAWVSAIAAAGLVGRRTPGDANTALARILSAGAKEPTP